MALSGIRDMSTIEEPPRDRQPVQTYVMEHEWPAVAEAIRRELNRGGQVYYLHNRVENIESTAGRLRQWLGEDAAIGIAHGKMAERELSSVLRQMADGGDIQLLVTTGGTGFAPRDVTPEATLAVCDRLTPGIPEAMRYYSLQITPRAMLSRAAAGIRGRTLIVNLPGSPKAVRECLQAILPALDHGLEILKGTGGNCAR